MPSKSSVFILLADDHSLFRRGFINLFSDYHHYHFLEANNGKEAVDLAKQHDFDIIFLDERMPELLGYDAAKMILKEKPSSKIIAFTQFDEISLILNYFKIGVMGFMAKDIDPAHIIEAINSVRSGNYYHHSKFDKQICAWLSSELKSALPQVRFSQAELEVIVLMAKGKSNAEIATILGRPIRTIESCRFELTKKTGTSNSIELMAYIYKNGILGN